MIGFSPYFVLVFKIWVLDSCPFSPGLTNKLNGHLYYFGRTDARVGRYSLVVLFWGLLPEVNIILGALREAFLPKLQVLLLPEPLFIPAGFLPQETLF